MDLLGKQTYLYLKQDGTHSEVEWTGVLPDTEARELVGDEPEIAYLEERPLVVIQGAGMRGEPNPFVKNRQGSILFARYVRILDKEYIVGLTYEQLCSLRARFSIPEPPLPKREIG